jgi:hypothetical protein
LSRRVRAGAVVTTLIAVTVAGTLAYRAAASGAEPAAGASIFYTGEQRGYLEPCGCSKPQIGGLARRATFLKKTPSEVAQLQIDNGDLVDTVGRQNELKSEALAEFFKETGYAAVNLGEKDFMLGFGYLRYLQSVSQVPMLSGNTVRGDAKKPVFEAYVVRSLKVGDEETPVALIGLMSPKFEAEIAQWNPGLKVRPPTEVLTELQPQIQAEAKLAVLLFHGGLQEAKELAKAHPWLTAVVTAHEAEDYRARAETVGSTILVNAGQKGKYLGRMDLKRGAEGKVEVAHRFPIDMEHTIADDPEVRAILNRYLSHVGDEDLLAKLPKHKTTNGQSYAGTQACLTCHAKPHATWQKSAHAQAWETLVEVKHDKDPDCVGCHVVGLEHESGFRSMAQTPNLVDVGCESCHGPQSEHIKNPVKLKPPKVGAAACANCHIPEHSPSFDFEAFWKKIAH